MVPGTFLFFPIGPVANEETAMVRKAGLDASTSRIDLASAASLLPTMKHP